MRALDVMTPNVISVKPNATIRDVANLFLEHRISGAPVIDDGGKLVGVVSEGDLIRRAEIGTDKPHRSWWLGLFSTDAQAQEYVKSHGLLVADVMTRDVISVDEQTPLGDVASLLETRGIKRVPVLRGGKVVGLVSRANLVQALASSSAPSAADEFVSDREIRERLLAELEDQPWGFAGRGVIVRDGVVHLWGVFRSQAAVDAVRVAAERIPGVKSVVDHTEQPPIPIGL
ncbi:histidine kinase [Pandoraea thiooxydans]|uniref:Histidine kinase n=1 Tax=Pandoraea thiooxydans TaxID=445709 RepID=A0A0G3ER21_9BURK|nr:CBS domain-containing protein [Pandoraea thiooxydans]AKJ68454.1 histidine kinase [Pandoraea thiooxydans]APR95828.1 histidine kinase [Pandoraea thiooxydans]